MRHLIIGLMIASLALPVASQAAAIPTASDLVLHYDQDDAEAQSKHNYLFTVAGDDTIYACETDHCNMSQFKSRGNLTLTIYQLPDGFPRPQTVPNQSTLRNYVAQAQHEYTLSDIPTNLVNTDKGLPYQLVQLYADGSSELKTQYYTTPTDNVNAAGFTIPGWLWWGLGIAVVVAGGAGLVWWRLRQLQS